MNSPGPLKPSRCLFPALLALLASSPLWAGIDLSSGYFGNQAVIAAGPSPVTLDNDNKQVGFSFAQREDALVSSIWVYGTPVGVCPQYQINVYDDDGGDLPATLSGEGGMDPHNMVSGWNEFSSTGGGVSLFSGNVYDLVVVSSGGASSSGYFIVDAYTSPLHDLVPFDQFDDGDLNTSYDPGTGSGFGLIDGQPVFGLENNPGDDYGNPYAGIHLVPSEGTTLVGEVFNGPNTWVSQLGVYLEKLGTPSAPLTYQLADLSNSTTLTTGVMATSATAPGSFGWLDITLPGGPFLLSTDQYRLTFLSPGSSGTNDYVINIPTEPTTGSAIATNVTFDGANSYAVTSTNNGTSYALDTSSDIGFRLLISSPPTSTPTFTRTPTVTLTPTMTLTPTVTTPTFTTTSTLSPTMTLTPTWTSTDTPTLAATNSPTSTPTITLTVTPANTGTFTPTSTATLTMTPAPPTSTATMTPTSTLTLTRTVTGTPTSTVTPLPTATLVPVNTSTKTPTLTPIPAGSFTATPTPVEKLYLDNNVFNPSQGPMGMDVRVDLAGQVKVLVFNINGEKVAEVLNQVESPGNYRAYWDGRNQKADIVGNGVYFLITVQPSGHQTRKLIILR